MAVIGLDLRFGRCLNPDTRIPGYPVNPDRPGSDSGRNKDQARRDIIFETNNIREICGIRVNLRFRQ